MSSDYISKSALYEIYQDQLKNAPRGCFRGFQGALQILYDFSIIDVEPVVHCKDCKFWLDDGFGKMCCRRVGITRKADFYCANGKRKDDNNA